MGYLFRYSIIEKFILTYTGDIKMNSKSKSFNQIFMIGIILAILGIVVSSYSLMHHIELKANGATDAFCNVNDTFSCDDVAKSDYSEDPWGNPLGVPKRS